MNKKIYDKIFKYFTENNKNKKIKDVLIDYLNDDFVFWSKNILFELDNNSFKLLNNLSKDKNINYDEISHLNNLDEIIYLIENYARGKLYCLNLIANKILQSKKLDYDKKVISYCQNASEDLKMEIIEMCFEMLFSKKFPTCPICYSNFTEQTICVIFNCNHMCCGECSAEIQNCHICRTKILSKKELSLFYM